MNEYLTISAEEFRDAITGKTTYRKCPGCDKDGLEYWNDDGSPLPFPHPSWEYDYQCGRRQECGGLAYIQNA